MGLGVMRQGRLVYGLVGSVAFLVTGTFWLTVSTLALPDSAHPTSVCSSTETTPTSHAKGRP